MFTKHDMKDFCSQLMELELRMNALYRDVAAGISHPRYKKLLEGLSKEEMDHARQVQELLEILTGDSPAKQQKSSAK